MNETRDIARIRPIASTSAFVRTSQIGANGDTDSGVELADGCASIAGAVSALMLGLQVSGASPRRP